MSSGDLFHEAVVLAKSIIWSSRCDISNTSVVRQALEILRQVHQGIGSSIISIIRTNLRNYLTRKRHDIDAQYGNQVLFECWIVNPYTELGLTNETYPIVGRIDEIDFDQKIIIERCVRDPPPLHKYVQALIYHRALTSLLTRHRRALSSQLRGMLRGNWSVIIETPLNDIAVNSVNMQFESIIWNGLRYVREIIHPSSRGWGSFFMNRSCNPPIWNRNCEYCGLCIASSRRLQYPVARAYLKPRSLNLLRLLLYESIWSWDRYLYALSMHDPHRLLQINYREPYALGIIRNIQGSQVQIQIDQVFSPLIERIRSAGTIYLIPKPYKFVLGPRLRGDIVSVISGTITVNILTPLRFSLSRGQVLLTSSQRTFITQTPPISKIILEKRRRAISKLRLIGTSDPSEYQRRGVLRFIDALTGRAPLTSQCVHDPSRWKLSLMNKLRHVMQITNRV